MESFGSKKNVDMMLNRMEMDKKDLIIIQNATWNNFQYV